VGDEQKDAKACLSSLEALLVNLLRLVGGLGLLFLVFGPNYSRVAVKLFFGRQWQSEETVRTLAAVCVNVFILALNGVTEAFVHAVAPATAFKRINFGYFISSVVFLSLVGPMIAYLGTSGLVLAGGASMMVRIVSSAIFIRKCFSNPAQTLDLPMEIKPTVGNSENGRIETTQGKALARSLKDIIPSSRVLNAILVALATSLGSSYRYANSAMSLRDSISHIMIGAVSFILVCGSCMLELSADERSYLINIIRGRLK
jgi:oligosaccharide translocation protein RFT1